MLEQLIKDEVKKIFGKELKALDDSNKEMPFVIVRTYSAGVHFGYLKSRNGKEVVLKDARRAWYWSGAATLSEMSIRGVKNPDKCKFPEPVGEILLTQAIEILYCTEDAKQSLLNVPLWRA